MFAVQLVAVSMACHATGDVTSIRLEPDNAADWRWATSREWEVLARRGKSSWDCSDVRHATRLASATWEAVVDDEG